MRRLLVTLLLALSSVVLTQLPAHACSCVKNDTVQKQVKRADVVFAGRLNNGSFTADTLWKGDLVSSDVRVITPAKSCGLDLKADRRYVVFAQTKKGSLVADSCSGTARAKKPLVKQVTKALGKGESLGPPSGEQAKPTYTRTDSGAPASMTRLAAPGAAAILIGLLGIFFLRRRR
jgi:hypothetical protein